MFPIRDHNPSSNFPIITLILIAITAYVFFLQLTSPDMEEFIYSYALIPQTVNPANPGTWLPFIYSMFMHGGWLHIISNMWFLWIFGDNIEAHMGHLPYLFFYLITGLVAGVSQYLLSTTSNIPTLGASGAVSGVLGAYMVLYPRHKIDTLIASFGGFMHKIQVPASFMLGYWFILQLLSGVGSLSLALEGGVAWWAHIGGFLAGWTLIRLIPAKHGQ